MTKRSELDTLRPENRCPVPVESTGDWIGLFVALDKSIVSYLLVVDGKSEDDEDEDEDDRMNDPLVKRNNGKNFVKKIIIL